MLIALSINAQSNLRQDSLNNNKNNIDCSQLGSRSINLNLFKLNSKSQGKYIINIEADDYLIFDDEIYLQTGDSYIIDMSMFPTGYYEITIINSINGTEQKFYHLIENEIETLTY